MAAEEIEGVLGHMTKPREFPEDLLSASTQARLSYFKGYRVAHALLETSYKDLMSAIRHPGGASLILVYGPTGVGKTTLLRWALKTLIEEALPSLTRDLSRIPALEIRAAAPDSSQFSWRDFYLRALKLLNDPFIAHRRGLPATAPTYSDNSKPLSTSKPLG